MSSNYKPDSSTLKPEQNHPVTIYSSEICPYCVRAKELFSSKGVPFKEIMISLEGKDELFEKLKKRTQWRTVPQIFIQGKFIGGFQELAQLEEEGKLDSLLSSLPSLLESQVKRFR